MTAPSAQPQSIGSIADDAGVTIVTIRYYDEIGIIAATGRVGGKRRFTADTVGRIRFIRRAQTAGFSLDEIRLILDDQDRSWPQLVQARIAELHQRRAELDTVMDMLHNISECGCQVVADCGRFERC